MELTTSHGIQLVILLAGVAGGYAVVMSDLAAFHKAHDAYKSKFDERLDSAESERSVITARVNTLASINSVENLADLNSRLARLEMGQEILFKDMDRQKSLHNGKHPRQE